MFVFDKNCCQMLVFLFRKDDIKMSETLTETITRNLIERNESFAVAAKFVDEKMKTLIPHLKNGSNVIIRKFYMDIPEFEIRNIDGVEIFIKDTEKKVVIFRKDIETDFKIQNSNSTNSVKFEKAVEAIHNAFDKLPLRCPYFKYGEDGIIFSTFM